MIEEIVTLSDHVQSVAYKQAKQWLASSENPDIKPRLRAAAKKFDGTRRSGVGNPREVLFNKPRDLEDEVLHFERGLISDALEKVNGKVTDAAELLALAAIDSRTSSKRGILIY